MKTNKLLPIIAFLFCMYTINTKAQCTFISPTVDITNTVQNAGNCTITFDLSFDIITNSGNKIIYIHLWPYAPTNLYPSYNYNAGGKFPPTNTTTPNLLNTLVNVAINNFGANPVLLTTYGPDPTVPLQYTGLSVSKTASTTAGAERFTIKNVAISIPSTLCGSAFSFKGDAWSSNSNASGAKVQCSMSGIEIGLTDPQIVGLCNSSSSTKTYGFTISTDNVSGMQVYYDVYMDNGDNVFSPINDAVIATLSVTNAVTITPTTPLVVTGLNYPSQSNATSNHLYVLASIVGKSYLISTDIAPCLTSINLGIKLKDFTAVKVENAVSINWTTYMEENNKDFEIQKSNGNDFNTIKTIDSKAINGTSSTPLSYEYIDNNINSSNLSNYRLKIVGNDGNIEYSEIRSINFNNNDFNIAIYPNPSSNGNVNIAFTGNVANNTKIIVTNILGQNIYSSTNNNGKNLTLNNLVKGIYSVNVYLLNSKLLQSKRFVVE